jgi:CRISPR-associated protein Cas5d
MTYQVPTYEALKGIVKNIYWKPCITWIIDEVRVMKPIKTESKGVRPIHYFDNRNDLAFYTYLKDVEYQVRAHFIFNENQVELKGDWNDTKHFQIAKRSLEVGGRRNIFLGCSECSAYVFPCKFGSGKGYYDDVPMISYGYMVHGLTYPDEAYPQFVPETAGNLCRRIAPIVMKNGIIQFPPPEKCIHEVIHPFEMKVFENIPEEERNELGRKTV